MKGYGEGGALLIMFAGFIAAGLLIAAAVLLKIN